MTDQALCSSLEENRWQISGQEISWHIQPDEEHQDHLEMSGKQVSAIITYGQKEGCLLLKHKIIYPLLRTIPNLTQASTICRYSHNDWPATSIDGCPAREKPVQARFDGVLTLVTEDDKKQVSIERRVWPATDFPVVFEKMTITSCAKKPIQVHIPAIGLFSYGRGSKGVYLLEARRGQFNAVLEPGQSCRTVLVFSGRISNQPFPDCDADSSLNQRYSLVGLWDKNLVLEAPDPVVSLFFRYAKRRTCESIFLNRCGPLHSPGGGTYYAAIWTNDQIEYAAPLFPLTGYPLAIEATLNAGRLFTPFMADNYYPIPSSIIAEGQDIWEGAGDRGDVAMYLYGMSRFLLFLADRQQATAFWPYLQWCARFIQLRKNGAGVICSDSDELEGRFPTGEANLSTSCLAYGGLVSTVHLAGELGFTEDADRFRAEADELLLAIERYFGAEVEGFQTYQYYEGNTKLRSWLAMPLTMGIFERRDATVAALLSPKLWPGVGLVTESGNTVFWDRATLYGLRGLFQAGDHEAAGEKLSVYCRSRLLGDHVPYPVEAWPEGNQRHLAAESALFCRVVTEGILGIEPLGFRCFNLKPSIPSSWPEVKLSHIRAFADDISIDISRDGDMLRIRILDQAGVEQSRLIAEGESAFIDLDNPYDQAVRLEVLMTLEDWPELDHEP